MGEKQRGLHGGVIRVVLVLFTHTATQVQKEERVAEYQHSNEQMRASRLIQHEMFCIQIQNISIYLVFLYHFLCSFYIDQIYTNVLTY